MPVMDGIEATKVIREIEKENKYTPHYRLYCQYIE